MTLDFFTYFARTFASGGHIRDGRLLIVAVLATLICLAFLAFGAFRHRRNLRAVPIRIHVAGTRGKSSVTRMIAAGLRAGGMHVLGKTTGSAPRLLLPDGSDEIWPRRGPAAIREQARFVALAARMNVEAIVLECMAIRPEMIDASERYLLRATMAVITNARPDHFEDLGAATDAMAEALVWATPMGGAMIVAREAAGDALRARAAARDCRLTIVDTDGLAAEAANRALALAVCAAHGVAHEIATQAIDAMVPDPGQFFEAALHIEGRAVRFANAFACNDVASLALLWRTYAQGAPPLVLFNARRDRPLRTRAFMAFLAAQAPAPRVLLGGDGWPRSARDPRVDIAHLRAKDARTALVEAADLAGESGVIWGVGNFHGLGAEIVAEVKRSAAPC